MAIARTAAGDVEIHEWGRGRRVIVALHAAASGPRALGRLAEAWASRGWRVMAPALSGYGATRVASGACPIAANVAIAQACLERADALAPVLFGHSFGGLVALRAGMTVACDAAVVVYEPVAFGALDPSLAEDRAALAWDRGIADRLSAAVAAGDPEGGVRTFIEAWNETDWERLPHGVRLALVAAADNLVGEVAAVAKDATPARDYAPLSGRLSLIRGGLSPLAVRLIAERLHAAVAGSRLLEIAGAGHMAPALRPDELAALVADVLAGAC